MTRLFTEGFEMGTGNITPDASGIMVSTSYNPRSGLYSGGRFSYGTGWFTVPVNNKTELFIRVAMALSGSHGHLRVQLRNGTTVLGSFTFNDNSADELRALVGASVVITTGALIPSVPNVPALFEMRYKMDPVSGIIEMKKEGIIVGEFEGNTGSGIVDNVRFEVYQHYTSASPIYLDDIAINDTEGMKDNSWCGDGHVIALKPNAIGDVSQLDGSDGDSVDNHVLVDDIPPDNDTSYVAGSVVDTQDLYNLESVVLPEGSKINRIWPAAVAKDPNAGQLALPIKAGGVQTDGSNKDLSTDYKCIRGDAYDVNPATGQPWTEEDLAALQVGVKIK